MKNTKKILQVASFLSTAMAILALTPVTTSAQEAFNGIEKKEVLELYKKHCQSCHGPDGKAKTRIGRQLNVKDLTDPEVQKAIDDEIALKKVKEGITEEGESDKYTMKPFDGKLEDAEIKALIAYMRTFNKEKK